MRLKLVEADDEVTAETESEETASENAEETGENQEDKKPAGITQNWDDLNTAQRIERFNTYFKTNSPMKGGVKPGNESSRDFNRNNTNDINTYIDNVFPATKLKSGLTLSIKEYGIDPKDNSFIEYVKGLYAANNPNAPQLDVSSEKADLIRRNLKDNKVDPEAAKEWLFKEEAYNTGSRYKVQALLLLSDKRTVDDYMDWKDAKALIPKILELKNDQEIADTLDNAQTRHGDNVRYSNNDEPVGNTQEAADKTKQRLLAMFKGTHGKSDAEINKAINKIFNPRKSETILIDALAKELAKSSGVDLDNLQPTKEQTSTK